MAVALRIFVALLPASVSGRTAGLGSLAQILQSNAVSSDNQQQFAMHKWAGTGFSLVAVALIVVILFAMVSILLLAKKLQSQENGLRKLHSRVRGLQTGLMHGAVKVAKDGNVVRALEQQLARQEQRFQDDKKKLDAKDAAIAEGNAELGADRNTIARQQAEIRALDAETQKLIEEVSQRKRVHVDLETKQFRILEPIEFKACHITASMQHAPPAEFADPDAATAVLVDLAMLLNYVTNAIVLIEGHTAGGTNAVNNLGFEIASERAEKVVEVLLAHGVAEHRLESKGKPGILGDNRFDVKVVTLSWSH